MNGGKGVELNSRSSITIGIGGVIGGLVGFSGGIVLLAIGEIHYIYERIDTKADKQEISDRWKGVDQRNYERRHELEHEKIGECS